MKRLAEMARRLRMVALAAAVCALGGCGDHDDMGPNPPWNLSTQAAAPSVLR